MQKITDEQPREGTLINCYDENGELIACIQWEHRVPGRITRAYWNNVRIDSWKYLANDGSQLPGELTITFKRSVNDD